MPLRSCANIFLSSFTLLKVHYKAHVLLALLNGTISLSVIKFEYVVNDGGVGQWRS